MSTEHNYSVGSAQYEWLIKDLAAVNRSRTPWLIFGALVRLACFVALTLAIQGVIGQCISARLTTDCLLVTR